MSFLSKSQGDTDGLIQPRDTFVLLDAGGGTVDAITYTVDSSYPLRLKTETVTPGGEIPNDVPRRY